MNPLWLRAIPYAIGVALAAGYGLWCYDAGRDSARQAMVAHYEPKISALANAAVAAQAQARLTEQQRHDDIERISRDVQTKLNSVRRDAAAAAAMAVSMRDAAGHLARTCRTAASDTGTANTGQAAAGPGVVLADVLSRIDARAGELAQVADAARTAGLACEQAYDAVRGRGAAPTP